MKMTAAVDALGALAQASRLGVFKALVKAAPAGLPAGEIATELGIAPATLTFHLKELVRAGLVKSRPDGRFVIYTANLPAVNSLVDFLMDHCCGGKGC
jgi:ArsR family transcriptional regulator